MSIQRISAGTTAGLMTKLHFGDGGGIKFGLSSRTVTAQPVPVKMYEYGKFESANSVQTASGAANLSLQRFHVPAGVSATRLDLLGHYTVAGSTQNSYTVRLAVYTLSGSTAGLASSASVTVGHTSSGDAASSAGYGGQSGTQWRSFALGTWNMTPGEYLLGVMMSQGGVAGTTGSHTLYGASAISIAGGGFQNIANPINNFAGGVFSAGTSAPPASVHISDVNRTGSYALAQPGFRVFGTF